MIGVVIHAAMTSTDQVVFTLETDTIDVLSPHGHVVGVDAMGDDGHHVGVTSQKTITTKDMWVKGIRYEIQGAPGFTLHHGTIFDLNKRDLECPSESPRPLVSVSQDQQHVSEAHFAEGYGVFIPKGTPLILDAMFHNPSAPVGPGETYTDVSLSIDLILADKDVEQLKPLEYHLLRLSDTPCTGLSHSFSVPPQSNAYVFTGTSEENDASRLAIKKPSRILYWGGHLHGWEGGKSLTVRKNDEVVESFETRKDPDVAYRYNTPHGNRDVLLQAGDEISIEAVYENTTDSVVRQAMGHLGLYIAEE